LTSKTYSTRPSQLLDVGDPYAAYCLDSAVSFFGNAVEHALSEVKGKGDRLEANRNNALREWLDMPKQYRNPVMN
jgi:hypothetical protein